MACMWYSDCSFLHLDLMFANWVCNLDAAILFCSTFQSPFHLLSWTLAIFYLVWQHILKRSSYTYCLVLFLRLSNQELISLNSSFITWDVWSSQHSNRKETADLQLFPLTILMIIDVFQWNIRLAQTSLFWFFMTHLCSSTTLPWKNELSHSGF